MGGTKGIGIGIGIGIGCGGRVRDASVCPANQGCEARSGGACQCSWQGLFALELRPPLGAWRRGACGRASVTWTANANFVLS